MVCLMDDGTISHEYESFERSGKEIQLQGSAECGEQKKQVDRRSDSNEQLFYGDP